MQRCSDASTLSADGEAGTQLSVMSATLYSQRISSSSWQQNIYLTKHNERGLLSSFCNNVTAGTAVGEAAALQKAPAPSCSLVAGLAASTSPWHTNTPELGTPRVNRQEKAKKGRQKSKSNP